MIDAYTAGMMVRHTQGELARARGQRNWRTMFDNGRSIGKGSFHPGSS